MNAQGTAVPWWMGRAARKVWRAIKHWQRRHAYGPDARTLRAITHVTTSRLGAIVAFLVARGAIEVRTRPSRTRGGLGRPHKVYHIVRDYTF